MGEFSQLLVTFLNPIILIMALVLALSMVTRRQTEALNIDILMGGVFSLAVIHTMADPIRLPDGGQFDTRGLVIGVAAAMFGPKTGLIVLTTASGYRLGIGNPGLLPGLLHVGVAYAIGAAWYQFARNLNWPEIVQSCFLGLFLSATLVAVCLAPRGMRSEIFQMLLPYTLACNLIGVILIRYLIRNELNFLDTTVGLKKAATTDHLTGLPNRRSLENQFSKFTQDQQQWRGMTALYFDIDKFKEINDTFGHAAGDVVLQVVSSRLASTFRSEDVFSRLGGDEFVVLLPNLCENEARAVAERCRKIVAETPILSGSNKIQTTISVGAVWTEKTTNFTRLINLADQALYTAKSSGRNAVAFQRGPLSDASGRSSAVA